MDKINGLVYKLENTNLDNNNEDNFVKIFNNIKINTNFNDNNQTYFGKPSGYKNINSTSSVNK